MKDSFNNPTENQKNIFKFAMFYMACVFVMYQYKKADSVISLEELRNSIEHSYIDTIKVSKVRQHGKLFSLKFSVNGVDKEFLT